MTNPIHIYPWCINISACMWYQDDRSWSRSQLPSLITGCDSIFLDMVLLHRINLFHYSELLDPISMLTIIQAQPNERSNFYLRWTDVFCARVKNFTNVVVQLQYTARCTKTFKLIICQHCIFLGDCYLLLYDCCDFVDKKNLKLHLICICCILQKYSRYFSYTLRWCNIKIIILISVALSNCGFTFSKRNW